MNTGRVNAKLDFKTNIMNNRVELSASLASESLTKYQRLKTILSDLGHAIVAFSGGVDSTLVAKVAFDVLGRERTLAVLAVSPSLAEEEQRDALALATEIGLRCVTISPPFVPPAILHASLAAPAVPCAPAGVVARHRGRQDTAAPGCACR